MTDAEEGFKTSGLCPSCFSPNGGKETCPVCGYKSTDSSDQEWNRIKPGTVLHGRYVVGRPLGQGGFGITYLGLDLLLQSRLAIKEYYPSGLAVRNTTSREVMNATVDSREDFQKGMEKFLEEARTLARFESHPNIVSVKDFFEENGTAYMVMAYLEGKTLLKHLEEKGGLLTLDETLAILCPVMDALDEVHASGMIHRDISPDNLFLTHGGQVKLLDFGASKTALSLVQQQSHSVVLKRGYSPYEQYQSRGSMGPWTDVYGMAATIYRCITGAIPPDALDRLEEDGLIPPSRSGISIPDHAEEALIRALSISPKNRPQSMREFREGLLGESVVSAIQGAESFNTQKNFNGNIPLATVKKIFKDDPKPVPSSKSSKKLLPIAILAVVVLAVAAFFLIGPGNKQKQFEKIVVGAEQGDPEMQFRLSQMYANGDGVARDYIKAAEWCRRVAEQGLANAQYALGLMYFEGKGVSQDYEEAIKWTNKAVEQGNSNASSSLKIIIKDLFQKAQSLEQKDIAQSIKFYEEAAEEGYPDALFHLGELYESGRGVEKDLPKAVSLYTSASNNGHPEGSKRADLCRSLIEEERQLQIAKAKAEEERKREAEEQKRRQAQRDKEEQRRIEEEQRKSSQVAKQHSGEQVKASSKTVNQETNMEENAKQVIGAMFNMVLQEMQKK